MTAIIDLTAGKVQRGRLTNLRTGEGMSFALNPSTIRLAGGSHIAEDAIPGFSDPLLRWMSGKTKTISFTLFHDGEITLRVKGNQFVNNAKTTSEGQPPKTWGAGENTAFVDDPQGYSIAGALEFLDSFQYPVDPEEPGSDGGADRLVLSFGSYLRGVVCVLDTLSHEITEFDPDLNPTKAKSDITLKRYVIENVYAGKIWEGK